MSRNPIFDWAPVNRTAGQAPESLPPNTPVCHGLRSQGLGHALTHLQFGHRAPERKTDRSTPLLG
jgi:hypothetical protein